VPVIIHYASGISSRSTTVNLSMGGAQIVAPDNRHENDEIEEIDLLLQSGAISIPVKTMGASDGVIRMKFEEMPLSRRRELVRVVLARADAWIQPPHQPDNPLRSLLTIIRTVFELFWLTWQARRDKRKASKAAENPVQEDNAA